MSFGCKCPHRIETGWPEKWFCRIDGKFCSPDGICRDPVKMSADVIPGRTDKTGQEADREGRKFDEAKLRYDLVPMDALDEVVRRFTHGAAKYAPGNWQKVDDAVERYSAALMRHYSAYRQGERMDPEASGLSHIGAVAWNALVLVWFSLRGHTPEK